MARPKKVVEEQNVVTSTAMDNKFEQISDERVQVTLKDKNLKNHTIYLTYGFVEFKDGKASVLPKTRDILKKMGVI